jgi:hypothetical protein
MKLTKTQLKAIIKEEVQKVLQEQGVEIDRHNNFLIDWWYFTNLAESSITGGETETTISSVPKPKKSWEQQTEPATTLKLSLIDEEPVGELPIIGGSKVMVKPDQLNQPVRLLHRDLAEYTFIISQEEQRGV